MTSRTAIRALAAALVFIVVLGVAGVVALHSSGGRRFLAAEIAKLASTKDAPVTIGDVAISFPDRVTLDDVRVGDANGEWLHIDSVATLLDLGRIVTGRIALTSLDIGEVAVARLPAAGESSSKSSGSLPSVAIDHLAIAKLRLAAPVLGESAELAIAGKLELGARNTVALTLHRTDGVAGHLTIDVELDAGQGRLVASGDLDEPTGVLLERLNGRREPLAVHLSGQGPLADFHGALKADSGTRTLLAANFAVTQQGAAYGVGVEGNLAGADLVPGRFADLLKTGLRFSGHAVGSDGTRIVLDRLQATADVATLSGQGSYDTHSQALAAEIEATLPDLARFAPLLGAPLAGKAGVRVLASGSTAAPNLRLQLALDDAAYRDDRVRHLEAALDVALKGDEITASGSGKIAGIAVGGADLPGGFGEAADWRLGGRIARDLSQIRLDGAEIAENGAALIVAGKFANGAADGTAHLAVDDLARLSAPTGHPMTGTATLDAVLSSSADGATAARVTGHTQQLATGQAALDGFTGGHLDLAASARRGADGTVTLDSLDLTAADAKVTASGALPPAFDSITAKLGIELSDLGKLAAAIGSNAAGKLSAAAEVSGPLTAPLIKATVDGSDLAVAGKPLGQLHVDIDTPDLSSTAGKLAARLTGPDGFVGTIASGLAWRDGALALSKLQIDGGGARIAGDLDIAAAASRGALTATIPDLGAFSRFTSRKLAGRIDGRVALSAGDGQNAELTLNGQNLALGEIGPGRLALTRLTATAKLTDLLGAPKGQAEVKLGGIVAGGGTVDRADLRLASTAVGKFRITGDAAGKFIEPVTVALAGDAALGGSKISVSVTKLAGKFGSDAFALTKPLTLEHDGGASAFSNLAFTIGPGSIAGNGKLDSQSIAVTLRATQLPVELAARLAGYREVAGRLGIDLDLQGSLTAPRGKLVVTGDNMRFAAASRPDLPPLALSARGDWQSGRVDFRGRVDAPHNAAIGFFGSAPFELRPGLAVAVPPNGRLAVKLEGAGELAQFNDLLPLDEDRISGHYALDASVEGTVAAPKAGGSLIVSRGRFEDVTSGLTLSSIEFELDGNQQRFVMSKFSAGDGGDGKVTAKGGIDLVATPGPAIDLNVTVQRLHAVRRDDADVTVSGTVKLGGTATAPQVDADITVENGELRIPDKLTASSPNLQVVRVDSRTGATAPAQSKPAAAAAPSLLPTKLAIKVSAPGRVFVRGHGLDAEWRGDLTVSGTSAVPIITGSLTVVRGTFSLLGKDFTLTRGTISFAGGTGADPVLDLTAEATSTGILVDAIISGTVSAPSIRLTSTPVMPQDEVLSRLLFGTTVGQITPIQGLQLAQAAAQLAGGGGPDILGTIRRNLGLDRLAVGSSGGASGALPGGPLSTSGSGSSSQSGISNTQLSAGKYVVPGFYVGVAQGVGAGQSAVRVEGEVTPNITIDAQAGGQARESIGLNFKLDY